MKAVRSQVIVALLAALGAGTGVGGCKGNGSSSRTTTGLPGGNGTGSTASTAFPSSTTIGTEPPATETAPPPGTTPPPSTSLVGVGVAAWHLNDDLNDPNLKTHTTNEAQLANDVLVLVNQERAAQGIAPVALDVEAERAAKAHAEDMQARDYLSHGTLGTTWGPSTRMTMTGGSGFSEIGENVAVFQQNATEVMNSWMNSPGHRANILNPRYTHLGVGVDETRPMWCQVFLRRP